MEKIFVFFFGLIYFSIILAGFSVWRTPFGLWLKNVCSRTIFFAQRHKFWTLVFVLIYPLSLAFLYFSLGIILSCQAIYGAGQFLKKLIQFIKAWDIKKRRKESQCRKTLEEEKASLQKETRKLKEENWGLRQKVRSLDGTEALSSSADFIEIIIGATDLFDRQIKKTEEDTSLNEYQKAQRVKDWESLRDIQIVKILEGESK